MCFITHHTHSYSVVISKHIVASVPISFKISQNNVNTLLANVVASIVFGASLFSASVLKASFELELNHPDFRVGPSISATKIKDTILKSHDQMMSDVIPVH